MTHALGLAVVLLAAHYGYWLLRWRRGFARAVRAWEALGDAPRPLVSVIVPARNEEAWIERCVRSVLACDYPADRFEVIVADDDSSDATSEVVEAVMREVNAARTRRPALIGAPALPPDDAPDEAPARLRLVRVPENRGADRAHKKRAIEKAIAHATGDIILTTDADCTVARGWIRAMTRYFADSRVAFVSGPVRYTSEPSAMLRLQALDFLGLMVCGGGGIAIGRPHLANGASVAYRRSTFERLDGFSGIDGVSSGDDELLMQKMAYGELGPESVRFVPSPDAVVVTEPVRTLREFLHQRRRWASKGSYYPLRLKAMLLGMLGLTLGQVALPIAALWAPGLWPWVAASYGIVAAAELAVLLPATRHFGQRHLMALYPLYLLLHSPQTLLAGVTGLMGRFEWKDRRLRH